MRFRTTVILTGTLILNSLAFSAPAVAENCFGSDNTAIVCYQESTIYEDCIYIDSSECTPVSVPGYEITRVESCVVNKPLCS